MASDSDLDDQLRAAMKVLDAEVPSGYWETLPNQTLARLEGSSMQQGTSGTTESSGNKMSSAAPPPSDNTEDSGLHDIRNLAQSTKQRISSKRITGGNPVVDDVASSSASWKAVALPQPAKMVALPELSELPSKKEIKAAEKAAAKERKVAETAADHATAQAAQVAAPVDVATPARSAFQLPSAQRQKSKGPLIAMIGLGVAAAAAVTIYVTTQKKSDQAPAVARAESTTAAAPAAVTATPIQQNAVGGAAGSAAVPASADVQKAEDDLAKQQAANDAMKAQLVEAQAAAPPADTGKDASKHAGAPTPKLPVKSKGKGGAGKLDTGVTKPDETKQTPPPPEKGDKGDKKGDGKKNADGSEPDFNDLLKEAGVDQNKKDAKPTLEKKSLTGEDFKKGMSAVADKAHGCYKGTQGSAIVKLTIAPSGQISKISVGGPFAGKPEATCVAAAVRGASFPAWDGGPMSFTYPILLSE